MRVLVCGTGFGRIYLRAAATSPFSLAGVLARGSDRSRQCAGDYGVPLFTSPDEVPDDVEMACVVVPSGVGGGPGAQLACALMSRGIPVVLEHPVREDELAQCLRVASEEKVAFRVNTFYVHLEPVRRFTAAAQRLLSRSPAVSVSASCAVQVSYDLLDIVGTALGGLTPWALDDPAPITPRLSGLTRSEFTERSVDAVIAGVPVTLRVNNQSVPDDPDHPTHLQHHVSLVTEAGTLELAGTHGPVLWKPAVHVPKADGTFSLDGVGHTPTASCLGPSTAPGVREVFDSVWPDGVTHSLDDMHRDIDRGAKPLVAGQYHLTLSQMWSELTHRLGYPQPVQRPAVSPITAEELM